MSEYEVELGDVVEVLRGYADCSFDAIIADPPYGLSFMGKKWDYAVPDAGLWREALRVCKPGAPLIAFSGTRTYHRTVVQIEDAGWEIRDCLAWMYGSGFPKSLDVSKAIDAAAGAVREVVGRKRHARDGDVSHQPSSLRAQSNEVYGSTSNPRVGFETAPATDAARAWAGYGTALKPAFEPAVLARKPLDGTNAQNVARWGVGGLAIDASRIESATPIQKTAGGLGGYSGHDGAEYAKGTGAEFRNGGRWPANVLLDEAAGALLDAQSGNRPSASNTGPTTGGKIFAKGEGIPQYANGNPYLGETGGASRFFYCAKAARKERDAGLEGLPHRTGAECTGSKEGQARLDSPRTGAGRGEGGKNHHPTVKPIALMAYLARLIMPPNPGAILVPFAGSGSEMIGCLQAGWPSVLGIEREAEYVEIARRRLAHHTKVAK